MNIEIEVPAARENGSNKKKQTIIIGVSVSLGSVLICLVLSLYLAWRKKKRSRKTILGDRNKFFKWSKTIIQVNTLILSKFVGPVQTLDENYTNESRKEDTELSSFALSMISMSTNNFSINNKLGEGGFGPVYKVIHQYIIIYPFYDKFSECYIQRIANHISVT